MAERDRLLLVLAGLSGSGKSYITSHLVSDCGFLHVPSITTRAPRANEIHGVDRIFCSHNEFEMLRLHGRLICESYMFSNWYGNDVNLLSQYTEGKKVVCQLRYFSVREMKEKFPESKCVYIYPKSIEEAIQHVRERALGEEETNRRILEITDEVVFVQADKENPHSLIDIHFVNDYSADTFDRFVQAIKDL